MCLYFTYFCTILSSNIRRQILLSSAPITFNNSDLQRPALPHCTSTANYSYQTSKTDPVSDRGDTNAANVTVGINGAFEFGVTAENSQGSSQMSALLELQDYSLSGRLL